MLLGLLGLLGVEGPVAFPSEPAGDVSYAVLVGLGGFAALVSLYLLLRRRSPRHG